MTKQQVVKWLRDMQLHSVNAEWYEAAARLIEDAAEPTMLPSPSALCPLIGCKVSEPHSHGVVE